MHNLAKVVLATGGAGEKAWAKPMMAAKMADFML
jgi:hypothetical protein